MRVVINDLLYIFCDRYSFIMALSWLLSYISATLFEFFDMIKQFSFFPHKIQNNKSEITLKKRTGSETKIVLMSIFTSLQVNFKWKQL